MPKPTICFLSLNIYHLLTRDSASKAMGGAELQLLLMGRELVRRGYSVTMITLAHDPDEIIGSNPFRLVHTYRRRETLPLIGFFYPRLYKIWKALKQSDCDIYYVRASGFKLAPIVFYARRYGKKVIYCGANDHDFDWKRVLVRNLRDKMLYFWGLRGVDGFAVQNKIQQRSLKENLGRDARIIYNGFAPEETGPISRDEIIWVGTIKKIKAPEIYLEVARRLPNIRFVMIGGTPPKGDDNATGFYEHICREAESIPNLEAAGFLPFKEVEKRFARARLLINTSPVEGFPNTFLQAWARGVPVISFVNPDDLVTDQELGAVVGDTGEMVEAIRRFDAGAITFSNERIKQFFDENLTIASTVNNLEELIRTVLSGKRT